MSDVPAEESTPIAPRNPLRLSCLGRTPIGCVDRNWWETPKNAAIVLGVIVTATATAALAGAIGYKIGQTPPAPIVIQLVPAPAARP